LLALCVPPRFINKNLLIEVTSDKRLARMFYWALKHHNLISYSLYMFGELPTKMVS
jgi:phosphatidate cytidylyltransferase